MHYEQTFPENTAALWILSLKTRMAAITVHLDPLPEGEVIASCTKELDNLRLSDLEDAVIEELEPGSGKA